VAAENLDVILGGAVSGPYVVGGDVMASAVAGDWSDRRALIDEARDRRLDLRSMDQSVDALAHGVKAARAAYYPRLDGFGDVTYANPNQRFFPASNEWNASWTVGVSLSWQLGQFMGARAQAKEVGASARVLEAQRAALDRAVQMEVTAAWHEHQRATSVVALRERAMASSVAAYDQVVARYRGGEATTTDVVEAEGERLSATLQWVNTHIDVRAAEVKLRKATGRMSPMRDTAEPTNDPSGDAS
jgi:outer membrane protein TolC